MKKIIYVMSANALVVNTDRASASIILNAYILAT